VYSPEVVEETRGWSEFSILKYPPSDRFEGYDRPIAAANLKEDRNNKKRVTSNQNVTLRGKN